MRTSAKLSPAASTRTRACPGCQPGQLGRHELDHLGAADALDDDPPTLQCGHAHLSVKRVVDSNTIYTYTRHVRIAELSERSGVPLPTVKYYLREGLLPPGTLTSPNQARYDEGHLRRLALVRALVDIGGLSIAATRGLLYRIDAPDVTVHDTLGRAQYALSRRKGPSSHAGDGGGAEEVDALLARLGWRVRADNPARQALAEVLAALHGLGAEDLLTLLDGYAECAHRLATAEVELVARRGQTDAMVEGVVLAGVLGDAMFAGLRRLAQEDASGRTRYPTPD